MCGGLGDGSVSDRGVLRDIEPYVRSDACADGTDRVTDDEAYGGGRDEYADDAAVWCADWCAYVHLRFGIGRVVRRLEGRRWYGQRMRSLPQLAAGVSDGERL